MTVRPHLQIPLLWIFVCVMNMDAKSHIVVNVIMAALAVFWAVVYLRGDAVKERRDK